MLKMRVTQEIQTLMLKTRVTQETLILKIPVTQEIQTVFRGFAMQFNDIKTLDINSLTLLNCKKKIVHF